jgi:hypothetical protein
MSLESTTLNSGSSKVYSRTGMDSTCQSLPSKIYPARYSILPILFSSSASNSKLKPDLDSSFTKRLLAV